MVALKATLLLFGIVLLSTSIEAFTVPGRTSLRLYRNPADSISRGEPLVAPQWHRNSETKEAS